MSIAFFDWIRGTGKFAVSVPAMDGALKPNDALDGATARHECPAPDNLVMYEACVHFSSGRQLLRLDGSLGAVHELAVFDSEITCLAGSDKSLAVGLDEGRVLIRGGAFDGKSFDRVADRKIVCPVAAIFETADTLLLCLGSQHNRPSRWRSDLLEGNRSGSVWRINLADGAASLVQDQLAFPYGIAKTSTGKVLVSESWRHRILDLTGPNVGVVVDDLPFYPARLVDTHDHDLLLCGFAPRRQLVEFILHEREFLRRMMAEVPERYWMAPALSSGKDFLEPLQGGQIRHHGILKSWSPTKSYGLLTRMDYTGRFLQSFHCRAGGSRHGITSAVDLGASVLTTAKGGGLLLSIADQET